MLIIAAASVAFNRYLLPLAERRDNALTIMTEICDVATISLAVVVGMSRAGKVHLQCALWLLLTTSRECALITSQVRPCTLKLNCSCCTDLQCVKSSRCGGKQGRHGAG